MYGGAQQQPTSTVFFGNLDGRVDRQTLYEIGIQAGPVMEVRVPEDPGSGRSKGFAFVDYESIESAKYAIQLFTGNLVLYGRSVRLDYSPRGRTE